MNFNLPVTDDKEKAQAALDAAVSEYENSFVSLSNMPLLIIYICILTGMASFC